MFRYATNYIAVATIVASKFATKESVGFAPPVGYALAHVGKPLINFLALKKYQVVETHVEKN